MDASKLYTKLRTGRTFLLLLSTLCAFWIIWNSIPFLPHFDAEGFPVLTLILSVEASIGTSFLMAATEKQDEQNALQMKYMLHMTEALLKLAEQSATRDEEILLRIRTEYNETTGISKTSIVESRG